MLVLIEVGCWQGSECDKVELREAVVDKNRLSGNGEKRPTSTALEKERNSLESTGPLHFFIGIRPITVDWNILPVNSKVNIELIQSG